MTAAIYRMGLVAAFLFAWATGCAGGAADFEATHPDDPAVFADDPGADGTAPDTRHAAVGFCITDADCPGTACVMLDALHSRCEAGRAGLFGPDGRPAPPRGLIDGTALRGRSPQ